MSKSISELLEVVPFPRVLQRAKALAEFEQVEGNIVPTFTEINSGFSHIVEASHDASPALDVKPIFATGREIPDVMITGGKGQHNAVIVLENGVARDVAKEYGLEGDLEQTVYGIAVADIDNDGEDEILTAEHTGVYVSSRNPGDSVYTRSRLDLEMPEHALPMSITCADTRQNGLLDMYVSTFIHLDQLIVGNYNNTETRVDDMFYRNRGDGTFEASNEESGLGFHQNGFDARFVDFTGDGFPDLVAAFNTDRPRFWGNNQDGTFSEKTLPGEWGFYMGIAIGDTTGNGLPDIFLANTGKSIPKAMVKKDLRDDQVQDLLSKHLRNDGNYQFTDITEQSKATSQAFSWGAVFADFTNNGRLDLVITENLQSLPMEIQKYAPTAGKLLLQGVDGTFLRAERAAGVTNYNFGYRPIAADLTGSGYLDLIIGNLDGPLRIFLNDL